jgi:hypothetical protein
MLHWFDDFKWLDIVLNMIALALVPFLYALVGGNLAVEGIADPKRKKILKAFFWGLFVVGILVIAIQQFTAARAAVPPDLKLTFSLSKNPAALASLVKPSVAKTVNIGAVLWDLDAFNGHSLNLQSFTAEYVKENQPSGPVQLLTQNVIGNPVKPGHRIFGFVSVSCIDCVTFHAYWIYFRFEEDGGWYAELPPGQSPQLKLLADAIPKLSQSTEESIKQSVSPAEPKLIPEQ